MKKSRFNRFAPDPRSNTIAILLAIAGFSATPAFAAITPGGTNTYNGSLDANGLVSAGNWSVGSPNGSSGVGSYTDLLFTGTDGSTFTSSGGGNTNIYAESYNVTNGSAYTLQLNSSTSASFQTGSTSSTGTSPVDIEFTNSVSGIAQNVIHLSGGSDLTFNATNDGGGSNAVMSLRQPGNFDVGTDSILTIHPAIIGGSSDDLTITGQGTTIFNGANTYPDSTTIAGGTLEIVGTNSSTSYSINGSGEPVLKLSNLNALPATSTLAGSNSFSLDGTVDLAVAGAYTLGMYNRGHIKFTASSGSPTSLHFTEASLITSGANSARVFSNDSANLSIVFDSTLDIGGDGDANVTITGAGDTTVTGDLLSTGIGARSLIKNGGGTLTLNGESAYTGTTTVTGGSLRLNHVNALPGGVGATGGTSNLVFDGVTGVIGLTTTTGDFLRTLGTGPEQVTANPNATAGEGESMGFAAYGGDRIVDFGGNIQLSSASLAGDGLTLGAADSDSKVTVVNNINLASSSRNIRVYDGSAAVDAEISGKIDSVGGTIVKIGPGTLALTGANTYGSVTGGTDVRAGVLMVNGSSLSDTSSLIIDGGVVDLTGAETVGTLFFGETQQSAGTYTSDGAGGTIASANFTGSGTLIVTSGPAAGDPFTTWAETTHSLTGGDALPGADPDDDGLENTLEFVLDGDPNANDSPSVSPSVTDGATAITLTFNRSDESELQPVAVKVQVSADLSTWNPADDITIGAADGSGPNGVTYTVAENGAAADTIVVTIPKNSANTKFVRLEAVIP